MLSRRQARVLAVVGFTLVMLGTPSAALFAVDYRLTPTGVSGGHALPADYETRVVEYETFSGPQRVEAVAYESLSPETQAAVDAALAGAGPWYRTPADSPLPASPLLIARDGRPLAVNLETGYHWESWRGKLPLVTAAVGVVFVAAALRNRIRAAGAVAT